LKTEELLQAIVGIVGLSLYQIRFGRRQQWTKH